MFKKILITICFTFLPLSIVAANDSVVVGVGGTPFVVRMVQKEHPSIRLVREDIYIKLPEGKVTARFVFRNEGPTTTVLMGFPESGGGDVWIEWSGFDYFISLVDGKQVKVQRVGPTGEKLPEKITSAHYEIWWVKRVKFRKGQTRVVVNHYQGGLGHDTTGQQWFTYVLTTGANWKGQIGYARIICDISGLKDATVWSSEHKRVKNLLIWEFRDFEPKQDIEISWWDGFWHFEINGRTLRDDYDGWRVFDNDNNLPLVAPRKIGSDVWLQVTTAARLVGASLKVLHLSKPYKVRIEAASGWIELGQGSQWALTPKGRWRLPEPVRLKSNRLVTYLSPVVKALGGTMHWDHRKGKFVIMMPYKL